jgi:hypothetical protein
VPKLRLTIVCEYEADPVYYDGTGGDPVKMAQMDQQALDDGDLSLAEYLHTGVVSATVEPA